MFVFTGSHERNESEGVLQFGEDIVFPVLLNSTVVALIYDTLPRLGGSPQVTSNSQMGNNSPASFNYYLLPTETGPFQRSWRKSLLLIITAQKIKEWGG